MVMKEAIPQILLTSIYASYDPSERRLLFDDVLALADTVNVPWLVGGDYNYVAQTGEKKGGLLPNITSMIDFNSFIFAAGLMDVGFKGTPFTWSNRRIGNHAISARLDRLLVNSRFFSDGRLLTHPFGIRKRLFVAAYEVVMQNTRWVLGNGSRIRFLDDVWFGELPIRETASYALQEPSPSVREVFTDLNHLLRHPIPQDVTQLHLFPHEDLCVWAPNSQGKFTIRSAYEQVRTHGIIRQPLQKIWHHHFSRRASIFSWLILHRAVPVDDRIAECGVLLPSRCSCCRSPQVEDLNHLFVFSDLTKDLWQWISPFLQAGLDTNMNISIRLWDIITSCSIANPHCFISIYSTMLIIWEIWKIRCKMKFDQVACSRIKLCQNIHSLVNIALDKLVFKSSATAHQLHLIREFGFSAQFPVKVVKLVRWNPPLHGLLLNVDGASKGNPGPCGGGGIIWDSTATMRLAFSHFYGVGSSLLAEVRAMCDGVQMALEKGFDLAEISTDSMTLVNSFQSGTPPSWECSRWWWTVYYFLQQF
ncbi:hypothetical protein Taro_023090 [Colocasia esculenta]|uniref:RNase H type-1 domain-containing protein n=1 Tax=Colocasia esculenta TaxID=4460 RepID=A0A843VGD4_COLES|nr:hypothetical protein [Colocasia esculenta]